MLKVQGVNLFYRENTEFAQTQD